MLMENRRLFSWGLIGFFVVLAGCTGETDPSKANLFDNINNLSTGEYKKQIAENNANIADLRSSNAAVSERINGMNAEIASSRRKIAQAISRSTSSEHRAQLQGLDNQYATLEFDTLGKTDRQTVGQMNELSRVLKKLTR